MAAGRHSLVLNDEGTEYEFPLTVTTDGQRALRWNAVPWEAQYGARSWRIPLHPWTGGIFRDRIRTRTTYGKAQQADLGNYGEAVPGPEENQITLTSSTTAPVKMVNFNNELFILCTDDVYRIQSDGTITQDKDLATDYSGGGTDMVVFNGELIVAMGESVKIAKRNTSGTWAQASDNVFAVNLAVVGDRLWRSHDTCQLDSCTTTPLTLSNWSTDNFTVGDSTFTTDAMVEYGGVLCVKKANGVFMGDDEGRFHNQAPQLESQQEATGPQSLFTAGSYLWTCGKFGLLRMAPGEAIFVGPDLTQMEDMRFDIKAGLEYKGAIYLVCQDLGAESLDFICKMVPIRRDIEADTPLDYIYHHYTTMGTDCAALGVLLSSTNPRLYVGRGSNASFYVLGRGAGQDITDANYKFGTSSVLEVGVFTPTRDMAQLSTLVGVTTVLIIPSTNDTCTVAASKDDQAFVNLLNTQEGGGSAAITTTSSDWAAATRYASASSPVQGRFFNVRLTMATDAARTPSTVWRVREVYAFGYSHPLQTDRFQIGIYAGSSLRQRANPALDPDDLVQHFRRWRTLGSVLTVEIPEYREGVTIRGIVTDGPFVQQASETFGPGFRSEQEQVVVVEITRVDFAGAYGDAPS